MKIKDVTLLSPGVYAHVCPLCGSVLASCSEEEFMPEFSICPCDRNGNRQPVYELFPGDGCTMIRRNVYPRFVGRVTVGVASDVEDVQWLDTVEDVLDAARAMSKAAEFLRKRRRHD